jgi:diaminopimelate decarboxylase
MTANTALPGQPHIAYAGDQLHVEGLRLSDLAREHGTPLFVYSKAAMLSAALPDARRKFATP